MMMKKNFVSMICMMCLGVAAIAGPVLETLDASVGKFKDTVMPVNGRLNATEGTIAFKFTPNFNRGKGKNLVIYRLFDCGNMSAGINVEYGGKNIIPWFLVDTKETGPNYGPYKAMKLVKGKTYRMTYTWNQESLAMLIDGKLLQRKALKGGVPLGDKIRFGGSKWEPADGLLRNVTFTKEYAIQPMVSTKAIRPGCQAQLFRQAETDTYVSAIVSSPDSPVNVRFCPGRLPIVKGASYWVESSRFDPQVVTATEDGRLDLHYPSCFYNQVTISRTGKNLMKEASFEDTPNRNRSWTIIANERPLPTLNQGHEGFTLEEVMGKAKTAGKNVAAFSGPARSGKNSLHLLKHDPNGALVAQSVPVSAEAGKKYLMTGFYHTTDLAFGSGSAMIVCIYSDGSPKKYVDGVVMARQTGLNEWRMAYCAFTVPKEYKNPQVSVILTATGRPFQICWDDLDLREHPVLLPIASCPALEGQMTPVISVKALRERLAKEPPRTVERKVINGVPQLLFNGKIGAKYGYVGFLGAGHKDFGLRGVNLQWLSQISGNAGVNNWRGQPIWLDDGKYDFSPLEKRLEKLLTLNPDAYVMLYLSLTPHPKFVDRHPEAATLDVNGKRMRHEVSDWCSYVAQSYREQAQDFLRALAKFSRTSIYGKALAGIHIVGGGDGQWFPHSYDGSEGYRQAFIDWLKRKYQGKVQNLRKAWQMPEITFATVTVPKPDEMKGIYFLNPQTPGHQRLIDGERFRNEGPVETVNLWAKTFKEAMGKPCYVSMYYNDVIAGHDLAKNAVRQLLASPWIDGYVGVMDYGWARLTGFSGAVSSMPTSATINGKIYLAEMDYRTEYSDEWIARGVPGWGPDGIGNSKGDLENLYQQRRDMGMCLVQGQGAWMYALAGNGWPHPRMLKAIEEANEAATMAAQEPRPEDRGDIACFIDEHMMDVYGKGKDDIPFRMLMHQLLANNARYPFNYSGLKVNYYEMGDLLNPKLPNYRMLVFLASPTMSQQEIDWIRKNYQKDGKVLVFLFDAARTAPGGMTPNIQKLTGIKVRLDESQMVTYQFDTAGLNDPLAKALSYFRTETRGPAFIVDDESAKPLGRYRNTMLIGAAVKRHKNWTGIYIGAAGGLTPEFLRAAAAEAGVDPVGPAGDCTYAGNGFLTIHATSTGYKTLHWKGDYDPMDMATGERVLRDANELTIYMKNGESRMFRLVKRQ